jgi:3-phenylpropionate/trans-cinnamate dioxygenase ferredoxin reductase subunit
MNTQRFVIVGAGLAGASAAQTLRERGFSGTIQLVGAEARPPYNRPPLSKAYLRGEERFEDALVQPADYYQAQRIELRLGTTVTRIAPGEKAIELANGERIVYDRLLVTTGGRNRALDIPGARLDGVLQLRSVEDADRIRTAGEQGKHVVVVGLGFIGCEVAASLRQRGAEVAAIGGGRAPLAHVLGDEVGRVLADIHRDRGVDLILDDRVAAFEGAGRVQRVRTHSGRTLECEAVVVGIGLLPNSELLQAAGAETDNGVLVDEHCRTSLPDVFAAGDLANTQHPLFGRIRVEHWNNGQRQGQAAARALLGEGQAYDYLHSFWSDQYEHTIEYLGFAARWDALVFRGRPESRKFLGFYLKNGVVRAAVGLNRGGDPEDPKTDSELKAVAALIRNQVPVQPPQVADENVDLQELAKAGGKARQAAGPR